jgi:hypothetical protein
MANRTLTADIIAKEAVQILENTCVMGGLVYRGYEEEYASKVNGYEKGDTISIRRPVDFTVRDGAVAVAQDVQEGKFSLVVDHRKGVDFKFTSQQLTLNIGELSDRVIKPGMIQLGNQIDRDVHALYKDVWNWVGTPGQTVDSFADFAKAPERLDLGAVPMDERSAVLSPTDEYGMLGSQTALYMQDVAKSAYRDSSLGRIAKIDTYSSQNVQTHVTGTRDNTTPMVKGTQSTTWASTRDNGTMSLNTIGHDTVVTIKQGDVFTISAVFAVNPVTKATLSFLQQFVVKADVTADATTTNTTTLTISPPIITSGAFQTVSAAALDSATITFVGATASQSYAQNLVFHRNAFSLVMVPLVAPPGAVDVGRRSYKGYSVRVIPVYDGINDESMWRLDVLYGVKTVDARLATRLSGT